MAKDTSTPETPEKTPEEAALLEAAERRKALLAELAALETANPALVPASQKARRFRVLHGAVSGHGHTASGAWGHIDFPMGKIVEERNLEPHTAELFAMGAIEEIE